MRKLITWLDDNILSIFSLILLVFIPLYPKLPLFDILPGYIVRVRLEDFLVALAIFIWIIWVLRKKIDLSGIPLLKPIAVYLIIGLLSMISAITITQTVPFESLHINKMVLHFIRRIEYFSLFFIFFSSVKSVRTVKLYLSFFILTIVAVAIYAFGQKYLYWPAFSTMNREFSKGWMLYLTEHARVLSTFGGHYDLAAFTMMALVILWSVFFSIKSIWGKILLIFVIAASFWTLILTASRTSFIAYILGTTVMFFLWAFRKGIRWALPRWTAVLLLSIVVMLSFGDLSERFTKLLRIDERFSGIKSLLFSPIGRKPYDKAFFLENNPDSVLAQITSKTDQPPKIGRPTDVYQDIPLLIPDDKGATVTSVARTYSRTAFIFDLSTAIRFDALWPQAIKGFQRNLFLGSGYSTLNKLQPNEFTEAESTDNDFLRALGETGILGFIAFFGTLGIIFYFIFRNLALVRDPIMFSLSVGLGGVVAGLLVNALYIDVFESSKVAFSFWGLTGIVLSGISISSRGKKPVIAVIYDFKEFTSSLKRKFVTFIKSDLFFLLLILILAFILRLYKINTPLADWHSWRQADTSSVTRNYVKNGINILYPTFDDISNVASGRDNPMGYRFVEFPLYNVFSLITDKIFVGYTVEISGRLTSTFAALGSIIFLFLLLKKYSGRVEALLASLFYAILPYNIFFTRVILPEPTLVFLSLGMVYFFDQLVEKISNLKSQISNLRKVLVFTVFVILSLIFTSSSLLVKPFAAFLFLPMVYLWLKGFGISIKSSSGLFVYLFICLLPLMVWRIWITQFPEGIPAYTWLFNGDGIRFKGAFFYWIFADRLSRLILGFWGLPLLILGILNKKRSEGKLFYLWGMAMLLYVTVVATGNVRHDYYQTITIPITAIFLAKGVTGIWDLKQAFSSKFLILCTLAVMILFMEMFGWYSVRDLYNINHPEIVEAGRAVEKYTPEKSLVIAPYNGDTAFLYQTHRSGWPVMQDNIENLIAKGADFYVSVNFDDLTKQLIKEATEEDLKIRKYKMIEKTDNYVIIQLVADGQLPR